MTRSFHRLRINGICLAVAILLMSSLFHRTSARPAAKPQRHRSPTLVEMSSNGRWLVTANSTSNSLSLIDLTKKGVADELSLSQSPVSLAWLNEDHLIVTVGDSVQLIALIGQPKRLRLLSKKQIGGEHSGIAVARLPDKWRVFVAQRAVNQIAVFDVMRIRGPPQFSKRTRYLKVGNLPSRLGISPNGKWLVTGCELPGQIVVNNVRTLREVSRQPVLGASFNLGSATFSADSKWCIFPYVANRTLPVSRDNIEKGWVVDNRLVRVKLPDGPDVNQQQMGLDPRGDAVGDAHAAKLGPDGKWLAVTCGGTHELLVFDYPRIPWPAADPGDFIPSSLLKSKQSFRRIELAGRPQGLTFIDTRRVAVANYLLDQVQIVDLVSGKIIRRIELGRPKSLSLARMGETIFYDADRSFNSWFSCHTCHTGGDTSGQKFDTLNDGNYDTYKLTPSLFSVSETGPWTWHGWQKNLNQAMKKSLHTTLSTKMPVTDQDARAMVAFLKTLKQKVSPHRVAGQLSDAGKRGKVVFARARCSDCHEGKHFTSRSNFKVGLAEKRYVYREFNPPSLRGVYRRRRFLHDGRADSLHEVLTQYHRSDKLTGVKLTAAELRDLIAYLKSL